MFNHAKEFQRTSKGNKNLFWMLNFRWVFLLVLFSKISSHLKIIVRTLLLINFDGSYIPFCSIVVFLKTISIVFTYEYLRLYIYNISTFQIMQMIHLDIRVDVFIVRSNSCFSEKFFLSKQDMNSMFTSNFAKILLR